MESWLVWGQTEGFEGGLSATLPPNRSRWKETTHHVPIKHPYFPAFMGYFDLMPVGGGFADVNRT